MAERRPFAQPRPGGRAAGEGTERRLAFGLWDARAVVDDAAHAYVTSASVEPAVVALRKHVLEVVQHEIERAQLRGDDGRVEEALRHLASVLLHTPSTLARRHAAAGRGDQVADAIRTLYGLEVGTPLARDEEAVADDAHPVAR